MEAPKIFSVINGTEGTADRYTYAEACDIAVERTERTPQAFMVMVEIEPVRKYHPVAFTYGGMFFDAGAIDCPLCDGDGLIVTGWNRDAYENIESDCPCCKGHGVVTGTEIAEWAIRSAAK